MEYHLSGQSGLRVSHLGLGTYTWGRDTDELEAEDMLVRFVEGGGTLVECSPTHGDGLATGTLAHALTKVGRHRVVLAWRGACRLSEHASLVPSASRSDMLRSLDDALARLGTDYVDVWFGEFQEGIPIDETLEALETVQRSGRAHYVGLSHPSPWDLAESVTRGQLHAGPAIVAVEEEFSLVHAKNIYAHLSEIHARGLGIFAHSPLAGGVLTGKYRHSTPPDSRAASAHLQHLVAPYLGEASQGIIEAVARAGEGLDRSALDISLAWVRDHPLVTSTIVGPRNLRQLDSILALNEPLPQPIRAVLDEVAGI